MKSKEVKVGNVIIGGDNPIVVQTMCNTHTSDIEGTLAQCRTMASAGAQIIRITVPTPSDVECIHKIHDTLRSEGIDTPLVADIHFSSSLAIDVAPYVEKVRINPGNFHPDHSQACAQFRKLISVCKECGTAIRIGLNHGSLGKYITDLYGNTPEAMAIAAMEWVDICREESFDQVVVSLKSSNTRVMVDAYRELVRRMEASGVRFPLHVGVTEAGNGDSGRIKSCVGIAALLSEGIGDTVRVSLTEDPVNEISVGKYLSDRYSHFVGPQAVIESCDYSDIANRETVVCKAACDFGPALLDRKIDDCTITGVDDASYLRDEILQASRRRFYKPEYIACPGCGRTMYDLQSAFEEVKAKTGHLKNVVIAVMGCIVNGPGEMADADWGYVGEGGHKVSIYHNGEPVLCHVPDTQAVDRLLSLMEEQSDETCYRSPSCGIVDMTAETVISTSVSGATIDDLENESWDLIL